MGRAKRVLAVLLLGAAVAVVTAGCGSSGSSTGGNAKSGFSAYETTMQALGQTLGAELANVGHANSAQDVSTATVVRNLRQAQTQLRATAVKLSKITPPAPVLAQHQALTEAVREYADELNGIIVKVKNGGGAASTISIGTLKGVKDMQRASAAISKAGYVINLGG